jgi:hypothetical protein
MRTVPTKPPPDVCCQRSQERIVTLKKDIVNAVQVSTRVRPLRGSDTPTPRHFLSTSLWQDRDVIKGALEKMTSEHQAALASKRAFEVELSKAKEELHNSERSCTAPPLLPDPPLL